MKSEQTCATRDLGSLPRLGWERLPESERRDYNQRTPGMPTSYRIIKLPYVPNAVRNLLLRLHPVRR